MGQFVCLDRNRITRLHSQVMTGTQELPRCHIKTYQDAANHFQSEYIKDETTTTWYSILVSVILFIRLLRRRFMSTLGCSPTGASEYLREPIRASDCSRRVAWTVRAQMGAHEYLRTFVKTKTARVRLTHLGLWSRWWWCRRQLANS